MQKNQKLILIVDDDADIRLLLGVSLKKAGYATLQASNGVKALELLKEHVPSLIVTDAMMPLLDGYGLIRAVKQQPELNDIPIILLTGVGDEKIAEEDVRPSARVKKPFIMADFLTTLEAVLSET